MKRLAILVAVLGVAWPQSAEAFVRTSTCSTGGGAFACGPGEAPKAIFWPSSCVNYHINEQVGGQLDAQEVFDAIEASFEAWNGVNCSELRLAFAGFSDDDRVGFNSAAGFSGNGNVIMVRSDRWDHSRGVLALTSVTFDPTTGRIVDSDIEINAVDFTLTTDEERVRIDVANTMTHEAGHFLGLDHTTVEDATMFATAPLGETSKRSLEGDDESGVCDAYPPGGAPSSVCLGAALGFYSREEAGECDERFFSDCDSPPIVEDSPAPCAACAVAGPAPSAPLGWGLALGGALLILRRRRAGSVRRGGRAGAGRAAVAAALLAGSWLSASPSEAFVSTKTCTPSGVTACQPGEQPRGIFWPQACVLYHINQEGSSDTDPDRANAALVDSFEAWNAVECSGIQFVFGGFTDEDRVGFNPFTGQAQNANTIVFRNQGWAHQSGVLALTSVTFQPSTGVIFDADVELNGEDFNFTTTDVPTRTIVDVANTMTHEAGHFLGLDHTTVEDATMFATAPIQELDKRTLSQDDVAGICDIYPVEFTPEGGQCAGAAMGFFVRPLLGPDDGPPPPQAATCGCGLSGRPPEVAAGLGLVGLALGLSALGARAARA